MWVGQAVGDVSRVVAVSRGCPRSGSQDRDLHGMVLPRHIPSLG